MAAAARLSVGAASGLLFRSALGLGVLNKIANEAHQESNNTIANDILTRQQNSPKKKCVVVIGGGVVGLSTALELKKRGFGVVVLEAGASPNSECSALAAGGLQRSNSIVSRSFWLDSLGCLFPFRKMANQLFGGEKEENEVPFVWVSWLDTMTDLHFYRFFWGFFKTGFLSPISKERQSSLLDFTNWSIDEIVETMKDYDGRLGKRADFKETGALSVSTKISQDEKKSVTPNSVNSTEEFVNVKKEQVFQLEPWFTKSSLASLVQGARYETKSAQANSHAYGLELADICTSQHGIPIHLNTHVISFETQEKMNQNVQVNQKDGKFQIKSIETSEGMISLPDHTDVCVCAGSWTPLLLRKLNLYVPMYPLKGYNFIIPLKNDITQSADAVPKRIVAFRNVYMTRFHNDLRVTAIGQFAGWDTTPTPVIADKLKQFSKRLFPHLESEIENEGRMSVGLRPFVADGLLLVGRVPPYHNLYVNSGPGSNGWKLCVGSGRVLAASVEKNEKKNREEEEEGEKEKEGEEVVVVEEEKREKENLGMELFDPKGRIVYSPFFCSLASFFHRGSVLGKWGKL